jgi:hypothetical protein
MLCEKAFNRKAIHFYPEFIESPEWHPDLVEAIKPKARHLIIIACSTYTLPFAYALFTPKDSCYFLIEIPNTTSAKITGAGRGYSGESHHVLLLTQNRLTET